MLRRLLGFLDSTFGKVKTPEFWLPDDDQLTMTASGLRYGIIEPGSGEPPDAADTVTVRYAGWLVDGHPFDASYPGRSSFPLARVIPGWTEGLQLLRPGGSAIFVIPPELAYGARGAPPRVGPYATLVFHVELISVG